MNFALLWIDGLLIALLWLTAAVAFAARVKRRWIRIVASLAIFAVPLVPLGLFVFMTATMKFESRVEPNWFGYSVSLLLAYWVGAFLILRRARRRQPGLPPAAAIWRRTPLALAFLMTVAVGYITLLNMDFAMRARCAILSVQVNSLYLATMPAITSDAQNAAPLYDKAFAMLGKDPGANVQNPPVGTNLNFDPDEPATITYLTQQTGTIALLRRAAALPACRFDQDLSATDVTTVISSLNEVRYAANLLRLHAREEIAHGNTASAIADVAAIFGMSRHFGQRPMLISTLVGIGVGAMADETLEETLSTVKSPDELSALHLDDLTPLGRVLLQGLRGDERYGLAIYSNLPNNQIKLDWNQNSLLSSGAGVGGAFFRVFFLDLDNYLALLQNFQNLSTQPYYKVRDELAAIGADNIFAEPSSIVAKSIVRAFAICAEDEAHDACAQTAVAMTRYRLDHGTLPSQLDALVPAYLDSVPIDPFDGQPIRLAIKGDQWIIYSVGPDGVDNGGAKLDNDDKGDITFTLTYTGAEPATKP